MKTIACGSLVFFVLALRAQLPSPSSFYPFSRAAGQSGSTAIQMNDARFKGWADGYAALVYGSNVDAAWRTPSRALGRAGGGSLDILCLGDGGSVTLTFSTPIANGPGFDFAVFENGFSDTFLELAWVEVSSDGEHFCRFPNYYGGSQPVGGFGAHAPADIYGLASKYRQGYGTPFDLQELQNVWDAIQNGSAPFLSHAYQTAFLANFPHLDLDNIGFVRLIDIVGNGAARDATGRIIYDPHPTVGSAGFDLDAVGVIHQRQGSGGTLPPTLSALPLVRAVASAAGSVAFSVTPVRSDDMAWTAAVVSGGDWARITAGASGHNAGMITVAHDENPATGHRREATIRVAAAHAANSPVDLVLSQDAGFMPVAIQGVLFDMPLPGAFANAANVRARGLPAGLSYHAATRRISGAPSRVGAFNVTLTATGQQPLSFVLTVHALPAWAWGVFDGVAHTPDAIGRATLNVTSQGRISGRIAIHGLTYAFSAPAYAEQDHAGAFWLRAVARAGRLEIPLTLAIARVATEAENPPLLLGRGSGEWGDAAGTLLLYRIVWRDPGMLTVLAPYIGYYTAALPGAPDHGSGYLTWTVDRNGTVQISGRLADDVPVSQSAPLILDGEGRIWTTLSMAPRVYQGGSLFGRAEFVNPPEGQPPFLRLLDDAPLLWESRNPQATGAHGQGFQRALGLSGGWHNTQINLRAYYEQGLIVGPMALPPLAATLRVTDWNESQTRAVSRIEALQVEAQPAASPQGLVLTITPATGIGSGFSAPRADPPILRPDGSHDYTVDANNDGMANTSGLTIRFNRATGLFTGAFRTWHDYVSSVDLTTGRQTRTHVSRTLRLQGVLTSAREGGSAEGRGFFLWPHQAAYAIGRFDRNGQPIILNYSFNRSLDFLLIANSATSRAN